MSNPPVVSVIIPTFNHSHFLRDALSSLLAQTYTKWEAIIINNFSEDDTVEVVKSFSDPRILLENFHNNGIIAASRNRGIAQARGKYVAFLDSDDTWCEDKLEKCMHYFDKDIVLVSHGLRWIGEQKRDMFCGPEQRATFESLLDKGNCITPSATVVNKDFLVSVGCFSENPAIVTAEDYHLWVKLARLEKKMYFINEILGEYRVHSSNQSGSVLRQLNAELYVFNQFISKANWYNLRGRVRIRRRYGIAYYGAGRAMQRNGKIKESWKLLFKGIIYWPFNIKNYIAIILGFLAIVRVSRVLK